MFNKYLIAYIILVFIIDELTSANLITARQMKKMESRQYLGFGERGRLVRMWRGGYWWSSHKLHSKVQKRAWGVLCHPFEIYRRSFLRCILGDLVSLLWSLKVQLGVFDSNRQLTPSYPPGLSSYNNIYF